MGGFITGGNVCSMLPPNTLLWMKFPFTRPSTHPMTSKAKYDGKARSIASRWSFKVLDHIAETPRAHIFKVDSHDGLAALKLYKEIGASGEGSGLSFLRNLAPNVGAKIHRVNLLRTAVLMEWLEGPTLRQLAADGQETRALEMLGGVAQTISQTEFRHPFLYGRILPRLRQRLRTSATRQDRQIADATVQRTLAVLDHLEKTTAHEKVMHGDLLFDNIILTADGPRVIDPKGWRGDPPIECAKCLIRPYKNVALSDFEKTVHNRASILADAINAERQRLVQWAAMMFAQTVIFGAIKKPERSALEPHLVSLLNMSEH